MIFCCSSHMRVDKTHRNVEAEVGQGEQELPDVQFSGVGGVGVKGAPGEPLESGFGVGDDGDAMRAGCVHPFNEE